MKLFLIIATFICIILESTLLSVPLTLVLFMLFIPLTADAYLWGFTTGIILDIFSARLIGIDSLIMLSIVYIFSRYNRKIYPGQNAITLIIQLVIITIYSLIFYKNMDKLTMLIFLILTGIIYSVIINLLPQNIGKKRLSL